MRNQCVVRFHDEPSRDSALQATGFRGTLRYKKARSDAKDVPGGPVGVD
jgi:hypothetical protein